MMAQSAPTARTGQNFAVADLGKFSELRKFTFEASEAPLKLEGKVFLKQILDLSSAEISFNNLPPNTSIPFYHKHCLFISLSRGKVSFKLMIVYFQQMKELLYA